MNADARTVKAAVMLLPKTCRFHGDEFGKLGYEDQWKGGIPRCESCVAPWRRMRALIAMENLWATTR